MVLLYKRILKLKQTFSKIFIDFDKINFHTSAEIKKSSIEK